MVDIFLAKSKVKTQKISIFYFLLFLKQSSIKQVFLHYSSQLRVLFRNLFFLFRIQASLPCQTFHHLYRFALNPLMDILFAWGNNPFRLHSISVSNSDGRQKSPRKNHKFLFQASWQQKTNLS